MREILARQADVRRMARSHNTSREQYESVYGFGVLRASWTIVMWLQHLGLWKLTWKLNVSYEGTSFVQTFHKSIGDGGGRANAEADKVLSVFAITWNDTPLTSTHQFPNIWIFRVSIGDAVLAFVVSDSIQFNESNEEGWGEEAAYVYLKLVAADFPPEMMKRFVQSASSSSRERERGRERQNHRSSEEFSCRGGPERRKNVENTWKNMKCTEHQSFTHHETVNSLWYNKIAFMNFKYGNDININKRPRPPRQ